MDGIDRSQLQKVLGTDTFLLIVLFFQIGFICVTALAILKLVVDQAVLKFRDHQPLPPECWGKDVHNHCLSRSLCFLWKERLSRGRSWGPDTILRPPPAHCEVCAHIYNCSATQHVVDKHRLRLTVQPWLPWNSVDIPSASATQVWEWSHARLTSMHKIKKKKRRGGGRKGERKS